MKNGDLVRFKQIRLTPRPDTNPPWRVGLLIEYSAWERVARVLYKGKILHLHPENVQKAGKKDI